jgi:RHS repeat-associated protein
MITPEGKTVSYAYDSNRRLTAIIADAGKFSISYDADSRRKKLTYPNKATAVYTYDNNGNLTIIRHNGPTGAVLTEVDYTYDSINNRLTRSDAKNTATYSYDPLSRLKHSTLSSKHHPKKSLPGGESYVYDSVGNRLQGPELNDTMSYDDANELLNLNSMTYSYDPQGNRIQERGRHGGTTYSYDDENRLVKVEIQRGDDVKEVIFAYDPFGRRIMKTVQKKDFDKKKKKYILNFLTTIQYVYDGQNIILEYVKHGKENAIITNYIHGPRGDEPLAMDVVYPHHHCNFQHKNIYYYHADGLGSIVGLTNARGHMAQDYKYDSFGNIKHQYDDIRQPYTYAAREFDFDTGLYLYRARYYDPRVGRFISRDPIGFEGGDVNRYVYVFNNPLNYSDPTGFKGQLCKRQVFIDYTESAEIGGEMWGPNTN